VLRVSTSESIRLYFDLLRDLADLEKRVNDGVAVNLQDNSGLHEGTKTGQAGLQPIRPHSKIRQNVGTGLVCNRTSPDAGVYLRRGHFDTRQYGATLITDDAADLRCRLSPNGVAHHGYCNQRDAKRDPYAFHFPPPFKWDAPADF
jgi:hypothetical protein